MAPCQRQKRRMARKAMKAKQQNRKKATNIACSDSKPLSNFTKFPLLPPELRAAIWLFAIRSPKVITAITSTPPAPDPRGNYITGKYFIYLSAVERLPLILTCKESYHVALADSQMHAGAVGTRTDIMYISPDTYWTMSRRDLELLDRPLESIPPTRVYFADMHQIAMEFDWCKEVYSDWHYRFIETVLQSGKMTHLFVVMNRQRLCQWAIDHAWEFAEELHRTALHPHRFLARAPREIKITILVKRWKHYAPQVGVPVYFDAFLSKFTAMQFKPGYRIKLDRYGIVRLLESDPVLKI